MIGFRGSHLVLAGLGRTLVLGAVGLKEEVVAHQTAASEWNLIGFMLLYFSNSLTIF